MELDDAIATRHSGRSFDPQKSVSREQIDQLIHAAHRTPSCYGEEPWRMLFCPKDTNLAGWKIIFNSLVSQNQSWNKNTPLLIAVSHNTLFTHNNAPNRLSLYDTGAASMALSLKATDIGLMAHQMAGFNADILRFQTSLPDTFTPVAVIAIGYEKIDPQNPPEQSKRKDTNELFKIQNKWT